MKLAITAYSENLDSAFCSAFGRAPCFVIWDTDRKTSATLNNLQNKNAAQGAGIQAAQTIVKSGARLLVTGHCGPKAFRVLAAAGIKVSYTSAKTVADALQSYQSGELSEALVADVEGHWA